MALMTLEHFQNKIGYSFQDESFLRLALTHSSTDGSGNYERLEFLGDRVAGLIIAEQLYTMFPGESEGDLAKRHAALIQGQTMADIAREIQLGSVMNFSDAERLSGGEDNDNILCDGLESLFGALYLDGGLDVCKTIIISLWGDRLQTMQTPPRDPKTTLQEWAQSKGLPLPAYDIIGREGPDHAPIFEVSVQVEGYEAATEKGASRRKAEKDAAALFLKNLGIETS